MRSTGHRSRFATLTTELYKHLQVGDHMLQAQLALLCDLIEIQKPGLRQPPFQKLRVGLAWVVWHVRACADEGRVLGDV